MSPRGGAALLRCDPPQRAPPRLPRQWRPALARGQLAGAVTLGCTRLVRTGSGRLLVGLETQVAVHDTLGLDGDGHLRTQERCCLGGRVEWAVALCGDDQGRAGTVPGIRRRPDDRQYPQEHHGQFHGCLPPRLGRILHQGGQ